MRAQVGGRVEVEIMGQRYSAEILGGPLYDANGGRMRSQAMDRARLSP
ncbi:MAG: hypothetical protein QNL90_12595 [Gammaproteobacteria bacterium]|nr:hypothetical protein [Gammaproteobacteria bacterium]MDX2460963.1 hypothetical protein [Gammaproteobacteria bacterium]